MVQDCMKYILWVFLDVKSRCPGDLLDDGSNLRYQANLFDYQTGLDHTPLSAGQVTPSEQFSLEL